MLSEAYCGLVCATCFHSASEHTGAETRLDMIGTGLNNNKREDNSSE